MNSDDKLFSGKYGKKDAEAAAGAEQPEDDSPYENDRMGLQDGLTAKHPVLACLVTDTLNQMWLIPYGSIILGMGPHGGSRYNIKFYAGDDLFELTAEGPQISYALAKFAAGTRATWHKGVGTKSITVKKVERQEGKSGG